MGSRRWEYTAAGRLDRGGAVTPVRRERLAIQGVGQLGQRRGIGFVADMLCLQPRQFGVGRIRAGLGHLGQAQIDRIRQNRGQ